MACVRCDRVVELVIEMKKCLRIVFYFIYSIFICKSVENNDLSLGRLFGKKRLNFQSFIYHSSMKFLTDIVINV